MAQQGGWLWNAWPRVAAVMLGLWRPFFVLHPGKRGEEVIPNPNPNHPQANAEWVKFTKKWRYNAQQRAAIRVEIAAILGKE